MGKQVEALMVLEVLNVLGIDTVQDMQEVFNECIAYQYQLIHEIVADATFYN